MNKSYLIVGIIVVAIIAIAAAFLLTNNGGNNDSDNESDTGTTVVDYVGRTVTVPESLDNGIVTVGKLSVVRMLSYFPEAFSHIKMVDMNIQTSLDNGGQNYAYVEDLKKVIQAAETHETDTLSDADKEAIGNMKPSLIIVNASTYSSNKSVCDLLADNFTLAVVDDMGHYDCVEYWNDNLVLDDDFAACFTLFGKLLKQEDRAKELVDGMNAYMKEIKSLMSGTSTGSYYTTGISYMGVNDMLATFPNTLPLMMVDGTNAYTQAKGSYDGIRVQLADADALTEYSFTDVILDPSAFPKLSPSNPNSQAALKYIYTKNQAGSDIGIHVIMPIVAFGSNWETVLIDAYYLANVCYGGGMTDNQLQDKCADIMDLFFKGNGQSVLKGIQNSILMKGKNAAGGQDLTIFSEQTVVLKDGAYYIAQA